MRGGGLSEAEIVVCAISEAHGPSHYFAHLHGRYDAVKPFHLVRMPGQIGAGPAVSLSDLPPEAAQCVGSPAFAEEYGADLLTAMRRKLAQAPSGPVFCGIAGACDLTTVTQAGVSMEALCYWPDEVGKRVSPA